MELTEHIAQLKRERNAVILAHNYQLPEVQDIADFIGDSLGLSIEAANTRADVIVFCGVHFMAETAKILSPAKKVLLPDPQAGCPMADMITADQLRALKAQHPHAVTLCYVNTSAEVKAECDVCCTSANAVQIVSQVLQHAQEIIFVPDKYLADYVSHQTHRPLISWPGFCPTHASIAPEHIIRQRDKHPEAKVIVHPECPPEIIRLADKVASTEGMCRYVTESPLREFIIGTEVGIIHRLNKENPDKTFYAPDPPPLCPNMKLTTLEKVHRALADMVYEITIPEAIMDKARRAIEIMTSTLAKRN